MRSFTKWLISTFIILLICFAMFELMSIAYLSLRDEKFTPASERFDRLLENNTFIAELLDSDPCVYIDMLFPHPYLGFVHNGNPPCNVRQINNIGLFGDDMPSKKSEDHFTILFTGGSVAAQFIGIKPSPQRYLEKILNARYISPNGKPFLVLNGGDGAWKQPQQTILYLIYSDIVDAVVTLDGFNEHYTIRSSQRFEYPASNFALANPLIHGSYIGSYIRLIIGRTVNAINANQLLRHSHGVFLISSAAYKNLQPTVTHQPDTKTTVESIFARPSEWNDKEKSSDALAQYRKYIRSMHALAQMNRAYSAFFIQPAPAVDKQLTPYEQERVGDLSYRDIYIEMTNDLLSLKADSILIYSLTDIFKDKTDSVYSDPIHLITDKEGKSEGYQMMAEAIAGKLAEAWKLQNK